MLPSNSWFPAVAALSLIGCTVTDPLYCDEKKTCTDPERPFCDLNGEYPASEGVGRTCIPDPNGDDGPEADAGGDSSDGGSDPDASGGRRVVQLAVGGTHSCAVLSDGALRCWGQASALGYASLEDIGDDEHPYEAGDVPTGGAVAQVALAFDSTCIRYEEGNVRCWGGNLLGQLGYGHTNEISGPGNTPDLLDDVQLNGKATQLVASYHHVCALLENNDVRCWGGNNLYQLATGDQEGIGDNEIPASRNPIDVGATVVSLAAGQSRTCALLDGGFVRCWGSGVAAPLGYLEEEIVGDDETPAEAGNINVGAPASQVIAGGEFACALLDAGRVRCWGNGDKNPDFGGVLGYQETEDVGDDESPASVGDLVVGGAVQQISALTHSRCAVLVSGGVRCWGENQTGQLGYGNQEPVGDNETPSEAGDLELGGPAAGLAQGSGDFHMCAHLQNGSVRCWGHNRFGQLGLGHTDDVGDDETLSEVDVVRVLE